MNKAGKYLILLCLLSLCACKSWDCGCPMSSLEKPEQERITVQASDILSVEKQDAEITSAP